MPAEHLLLLHGWGMHRGIWQEISQQLSEKFVVHHADLPGHGQCASLPAEQWVENIAASFDFPLNICGWSLGGQIALECARLYPEKIKKIVLVATTPSFVAKDDWLHGLSRATFSDFAQQLETDFAATLQRFLALQVRGGDDPRKLLTALRQNLQRAEQPQIEGLRAGLKLLLENDLRQNIAEIRQRALVIHGEKDQLSPWQAGKWLAENLPRGQLSTIPGAAHAPFLSHPGIFAAILHEFIDGN